MFINFNTTKIIQITISWIKKFKYFLNSCIFQHLIRNNKKQEYKKENPTGFSKKNNLFLKIMT